MAALGSGLKHWYHTRPINICDLRCINPSTYVNHIDSQIRVREPRIVSNIHTTGRQLHGLHPVPALMDQVMHDEGGCTLRGSLKTVKHWDHNRWDQRSRARMHRTL